MIRKPLALLLLCLLPLRAYGYACIPNVSCPGIFWNGAHASMRSFLGSPGVTLANGTTTWDQNAINAANDWNDQGGFHFDVLPTDISQFINPCGSGAGHACPNTGP